MALAASGRSQPRPPRVPQGRGHPDQVGTALGTTGGGMPAPEVTPLTNRRSQFPHALLNGVEKAQKVVGSGRRRIMTDERVRRNADTGISIAQQLGVDVEGDNLHPQNPIESNLLYMQGGAVSANVRVGVDNSG